MTLCRPLRRSWSSCCKGDFDALSEGSVITSGKYGGAYGTVESNVHQRTVDYPDELTNGYRVMLDTEELVTVRWEQVGG